MLGRFKGGSRLILLVETEEAREGGSRLKLRPLVGKNGRRQKKILGEPVRWPEIFRDGQRPTTAILLIFSYAQKGGPNFFQRGHVSLSQ